MFRKMLSYINTKFLKDKCRNSMAAVGPYTFFTFIDEACVKCLTKPVALLFEETFVNLKVLIQYGILVILNIEYQNKKT